MEALGDGASDAEALAEAPREALTLALRAPVAEVLPLREGVRSREALRVALLLRVGVRATEALADALRDAVALREAVLVDEASTQTVSAMTPQGVPTTNPLGQTEHARQEDAAEQAVHAEALAPVQPVIA